MLECEQCWAGATGGGSFASQLSLVLMLLGSWCWGAPRIAIGTPIAVEPEPAPVPAEAGGEAAAFDGTRWLVVYSNTKGQLAGTWLASDGSPIGTSFPLLGKTEEVGARLVSYRRARHAAEALEQSLAHGEADWVLYCHQDVYFPSGFGHRLNELLAAIPPEEHARTLIGFAGMGANLAANRCEPAGFVIDRRNRFDHAESAAAVSIDELAIVVSRRSLHRIDPALGWHLWATDLCLQARASRDPHEQACIVEAPLFHNSSTAWSLPEAFHASAQVLLDKYPALERIPTLCGELQRQAAAVA